MHPHGLGVVARKLEIHPVVPIGELTNLPVQ